MQVELKMGVLQISQYRIRFSYNKELRCMYKEVCPFLDQIMNTT